MDAADDDLDLEDYMKDQKLIKREATKHRQAADDHMEDDELLSATTALDDDKKKKATAANVGGSGIRKGSSTAGSTGAGAGGGGTSSMKCCQAEKCTADLTDAKQYHRRHKVCEHHAKAQVVIVGGIRQRFCQQCSRFHELSEFDEAKRSCRRRLAGHNERRRKNAAEAEGSNRRASTGTQMKDIVCGQVDDRGRIQITIQENATYKHFQIR